MISADTALKMGAKKLKDYLKKNNFKFEISTEKINDWLKEKDHNDLSVVIEEGKIKVQLED